MAYFPGRTGGLVVGILPFHGGINFADRQSFFWTSEDCAAEDDRKGMLWSAICVWEAIEGIWAVFVGLVGFCNEVILIVILF